MNWENQLIWIYITVCSFFNQHKETIKFRSEKCFKPEFTDEEVATVYLFGIIQFHSNKKEIHMHVKQFLHEWFPCLPEYEAFNYRVNQQSEIFHVLCNFIISQLKCDRCYVENLVLVDSLPIMLATGFRATKAKVARGTADFGYCASKNIYYHGMKLHMMAKYNESILPTPKEHKLTKASTHDLPAIKKLFYKMKNTKIIGDKAYVSKALKRDLKKNNVEIHTPVKFSKFKKVLSSDEETYSEIVSSFRQPIESMFNWLIEKTGIQKASKVRSTNGLLTHVFGRLAGGLLLLHFSF